jgi:hypothetical protein
MLSNMAKYYNLKISVDKTVLPFKGKHPYEQRFIFGTQELNR